MRADSQGGRPDHMKAGSGGSNKQQGIFLGKVKDNTDPEGLGRIRVWISQLGSANEADESSWFTMRYCPPFAGAQAEKKESRSISATTLPETNQSYGFWAVPPDKDVFVICGFINGESHQGVWWACLPHDGHTHSLPGVASGPIVRSVTTPGEGRGATIYEVAAAVLPPTTTMLFLPPKPSSTLSLADGAGKKGLRARKRSSTIARMQWSLLWQSQTSPRSSASAWPGPASRRSSNGRAGAAARASGPSPAP